MRVRFKYNDITLNMGISYSKHKEINFFWYRVKSETSILKSLVAT
jgi:hypothetical protein